MIISFLTILLLLFSGYTIFVTPEAVKEVYTCSLYTRA